MDCRQARDALIAAADHEPAPAERDALASHLAGCAACRRFAAGARGWRATHRGGNSTGFVATTGQGVPWAGGQMPPPTASPDLTEKVLASVRPLPPPWVYERARRERRVSHVVGFAVAAVGATLAFLTVSLALIVALANDAPAPPTRGGAMPRLATEAMVNASVRGWFDSLTTDAARLAVTLALLTLLAAALLRWLRAFAARVGHDE